MDNISRSFLTRAVRSWTLQRLDSIKKVEPILRLPNIKFNEADFKIRFDMNQYSISPGVNLCIGDVCNLEPKFHLFFNQHVRPDGRKYSLYSLPSEGMAPQLQSGIQGAYILLSFVELECRHYKETFCMLGSADGHGEHPIDVFKKILSDPEPESEYTEYYRVEEIVKHLEKCLKIETNREKSVLLFYPEGLTVLDYTE
jgi:hypothetical protein